MKAVIHYISHYYVACGNDTLTVTPQFFEDGAVPIVWDNKGALRVIPRERVENMITYLGDYAKAERLESPGAVVHDVVLSKGTFYWEEGYDLLPSALKMLNHGL